MSDTTRGSTPHERVPPTASNLLDPTSAYAQNKSPNTAQTLANVTTNIDAPLTTRLTSTLPETQPNPQTLFIQLVNALNLSDENICILINHLPSTWQATNYKGTPLNKTMLQRSSWASLEKPTNFKRSNRQYSRHIHHPTTQSRNTLHTSRHQ
jgi:hypothetical protein